MLYENAVCSVYTGWGINIVVVCTLMYDVLLRLAQLHQQLQLTVPHAAEKGHVELAQLPRGAQPEPTLQVTLHLGAHGEEILKVAFLEDEQEAQFFGRDRRRARRILHERRLTKVPVCVCSKSKRRINPIN